MSGDGGSRLSMLMSSALLTAEAVLVALIIYRVPYTKIDWDAYMSQVDGFLAGERNYTNLRGDTGPLVYPAGFLYFYSVIRYLTGGAVFPAQVMFGILYILNVGTMLLIYQRTRMLPWWALCLLCLSKRVHSIFVLRLFNDCVAMTLAHLAILFFQSNKWKSGMVIYSIAVSVKMNVLLYAPALLLLMLKALPLADLGVCLSLAAFVQLKVLASHEGGLVPAIKSNFGLGNLKNFKPQLQGKTGQSLLASKYVATVLFTGNFIGILCARSLHYQFYCWYFFTLPYLLWLSSIPTFLRLVIFGAVEACWNVYPSSNTSSLVLLSCHLVILWGLWKAPCEHPFTTNQTKLRQHES